MEVRVGPSIQHSFTLRVPRVWGDSPLSLSCLSRLQCLWSDGDSLSVHSQLGKEGGSYSASRDSVCLSLVVPACLSPSVPHYLRVFLQSLVARLHQSKQQLPQQREYQTLLSVSSSQSLSRPLLEAEDWALYYCKCGEGPIVFSLNVRSRPSR